jgi:putative transposase
MLKLALIFLRSMLKSRQSMALEIIALRHQLDVLQRNAKRPRLNPSDRALWAVLFHVLPDRRRHLTIVQPDTVVRWHRVNQAGMPRPHHRAERPSPQADSQGVLRLLP